MVQRYSLNNLCHNFLPYFLLILSSIPCPLGSNFSQQFAWIWDYCCGNIHNRWEAFLSIFVEHCCTGIEGYDHIWLFQLECTNYHWIPKLQGTSREIWVVIDPLYTVMKILLSFSQDICIIFYLVTRTIWTFSHQKWL